MSGFGFEVEGRIGSELELELPYSYVDCGSTGSKFVKTVSSNWIIDSLWTFFAKIDSIRNPTLSKKLNQIVNTRIIVNYGE